MLPLDDFFNEVLPEGMDPQKVHPLVKEALVIGMVFGPEGLGDWVRSLTPRDREEYVKGSLRFFKEVGGEYGEISTMLSVILSLFGDSGQDGEYSPPPGEMPPPHEFKGVELGSTVVSLDENGRIIPGSEREVGEAGWNYGDEPNWDGGDEEIRFDDVDLRRIELYNLLHQPIPSQLQAAPWNGRTIATVFPRMAQVNGELRTIGLEYIPPNTARYASQMFSIPFPN